MRIKQVYDTKGFVWYNVRALVKTVKDGAIEFEMRFLCDPNDLSEVIEETCEVEFGENFIGVLMTEVLVKGIDYD